MIGSLVLLIVSFVKKIMREGLGILALLAVLYLVYSSATNEKGVFDTINGIFSSLMYIPNHIMTLPGKAVELMGYANNLLLKAGVEFQKIQKSPPSQKEFLINIAKVGMVLTLIYAATLSASSFLKKTPTKKNQQIDGEDLFTPETEQED